MSGGTSDSDLSGADTDFEDVPVPSLALGTADPHVVCDVDTVPLPLRAAPFAVSAHVTATPADLRGRPFPRANVPPRTAPRLPPPVPPAPPVVTRLEQVVPVHTQRLVRQWRKLLRRCMRAAARGDFGLARRLRPDDLWLEHAQHSVPATAPWDWDLTPLSVGQPAEALPVSGRDGVLPDTGVCVWVPGCGTRWGSRMRRSCLRWCMGCRTTVCVVAVRCSVLRMLARCGRWLWHRRSFGSVWQRAGARSRIRCLAGRSVHARTRS